MNYRNGLLHCAFALLLHLWSVVGFSKTSSNVQLQQPLLRKLSIVSSSCMPILVSAQKSYADTSISEEEVLNVVGQVSALPSPTFILVAAALVFLGVGALQFSLGDLNKEVRYHLVEWTNCSLILTLVTFLYRMILQEAQARVRDFLQTKRDTERKRGYFDDPM